MATRRTRPTSCGSTVQCRASSVNSGSLNLQTVSENTTLASLNGGQGVAQGYFTITGSNGAPAPVNIGATKQTLGDVITSINSLGSGVTASLNSAGNGILLTDTSGGSGTLKVTEGSTTTAADLHLLTAPRRPLSAGRRRKRSTAAP